jgi:hypothetical protein
MPRKEGTSLRSTPPQRLLVLSSSRRSPTSRCQAEIPLILRDTPYSQFFILGMSHTLSEL